MNAIPGSSVSSQTPGAVIGLGGLVSGRRQRIRNFICDETRSTNSESATWLRRTGQYRAVWRQDEEGRIESMAQIIEARYLICFL